MDTTTAINNNFAILTTFLALPASATACCIAQQLLRWENRCLFDIRSFGLQNAQQDRLLFYFPCTCFFFNTWFF